MNQLVFYPAFPPFFRIDSEELTSLSESLEWWRSFAPTPPNQPLPILKIPTLITPPKIIGAIGVIIRIRFVGNQVIT